MGMTVLGHVLRGVASVVKVAAEMLPVPEVWQSVLRIGAVAMAQAAAMADDGRSTDEIIESFKGIDKHRAAEIDAEIDAELAKVPE